MDDYHNSNQNQPESSDNSWQSDNSQPQNNDQNNTQNDYQNNYQNNYQYEAPQKETNRLAVAFLPCSPAAFHLSSFHWQLSPLYW